MEFKILVTLLVLLAILLITVFIYRYHAHDEMMEIRKASIEKFIWAEHGCDPGGMWSSMYDFARWCPKANKRCKQHPRCTQCRDEFGWYDVMMEKYNGKGNPNADPQVFIEEILEARRACRDRDKLDQR